ncbi:MAG: type II secretion system protein GspK, partial [Phycisphaerales bacterium JB059]
SPNTAPIEVLRAIIGGVTEDDGLGVSVATSIVERRDSDTLSWSEVSDMLQQAGTGDADRRELQRFFTFDPELWFVRVEVKPRGTRRISARYGGLTYIPSGSRRGASNDGSGTGVFLTWENLGGDP